MGSPYDPPYSSTTESPVHPVAIDDFYICKFEITQAQWYAVMGGFPSGQPATGSTNPVVYVSWNDAQSFIAKLELLGISGFRLPSEAEWEYACRAGSNTRWYYGDDPALLGDYAWFGGISSNFTVTVGQKVPNAFGLYDMHGNAWEWCEDDWHSTYEGAPTDGSAWIESSRAASRVLRGGAIFGTAGSCRSARRLELAPGSRYRFGGVRFARTL